jgi:lipopolysaccharide exporter
LSEATEHITKKSVDGLLWMLSGKAGIAILRVMSIAVLARLLSPEDFGIVQAATIVTGFLELFSMFGIGPALVQFKSLTKDHISTAFTITMIFGGCLALLVWISAEWIESFFLFDNLASVLTTLALLFPIRSISSVSQNLLFRQLAYSKIAKAEFIGFLGYFTVSIVFSMLGYRYWSLVLGYYANYILLSVVFFYFQPHSLRLHLSNSSLRELMGFGSGVTLTYFFNYIAMKGDYIIIGRFLGAGSLGIYGRAYNLMAASASLFGHVVDMVSFTAMSKKQEELGKLELAYRRSMSLIALAILPFSIFAIILAKEIIQVFLGAGWSAAILPFQVLASTLIFRIAYKMNDALARAKGKTFQVAGRHVVYACAVLLGSFIGHYFGLAGIAVGVASAFVLHFYFMTQLTLRILPNLSWKAILSLFKPALLISLLLNVNAFFFAQVMRSISLPSIVIIVVCLCFFLLSVVALLRYLPAHFWGQEGLWILQMVREKLPKKISFLDKLLIKSKASG